jgi:hypothetical protein
LARADPEGARTYEALLQRAKDDPAILAFWLGGSRGMGRPTEFSDYDVGIIVGEEAYRAFCQELGLHGPFQADWRPGVDLAVRTFPMFEAFAAWGSAEAPFRYAFAHLKALVDKTGRAQPLIDGKGCVPHDAVAGFIEDSLDYLINQLYRALKCLRDGDAPASRLEAAEAVKPFLDAVFALHGGRLRPYYKYLAWELETYPLDRLALGPQDILGRLTDVLGEHAAFALRNSFAATLPAFRTAGFTASIGGWGEAMDWMLAWRPAHQAEGTDP